ncbi:hypothetical protein [Microseira wollei]|nr:hypothetical protein [Microseira wollei]
MTQRQKPGFFKKPGFFVGEQYYLILGQGNEASTKSVVTGN